MADKVKQHYVPQFYLRGFSSNKHSINTFILSSEKFIENASIKNMCQKDNFYGEDKVVENFLHTKIENKAAIILRNIKSKRKFLDIMEETEDWILLLQFLLLSEVRNLKSADSINNYVDYIYKTMIKGNSEFRAELKEKEIDIDSFKISWKTPVNEAIGWALDGYPLISDLQTVLIFEKSGARKFITSDNPLVRYNSLYLSNNYVGAYGLTTRGLLLFYPISDDICILLYDDAVYDIPGAEEGILALEKASDIDRLNELFYLNAYNNVFLNQSVKPSYIEGLSYKNKKYEKMRNLENEINTYNVLDNNRKKITYMAHNRVKKKLKFNWLQLNEYAYHLRMPPHLGGIHRDENSFIEEELIRQRDEYKRYK